MLRLEVLFGDRPVLLHSSDQTISTYIKNNYPIFNKNLKTFEVRFEKQFSYQERTVQDLMTERQGSAAMMRNGLFESYQKAVSAEFQFGFKKHLRRRLLRAALQQEKTIEGKKALTQGVLRNDYFKQVLLSRYKEFFKNLESIQRPVKGIEIRNVSETDKPFLDEVLLRTILDEKIGSKMSRKTTLQLALYDYYYSLSVKEMGRYAADFIFFLTRQESLSLKRHLFYDVEGLSGLLSIHLLAR